MNEAPAQEQPQPTKDPLFDLEPPQATAFKERLADDPLLKLDPPSEEVWSSARDVLFDLGDDGIEEETKE